MGFYELLRIEELWVFLGSYSLWWVSLACDFLLGCGLQFWIADLGICMLMCSDLDVCIGVVVVWGLDCDGGGFVWPLVAFSFCRCGWSCGCCWSMLFSSLVHVGAVFVWNHGRVESFFLFWFRGKGTVVVPLNVFFFFFFFFLFCLI